jgi:hypothetical protein
VTTDDFDTHRERLADAARQTCSHALDTILTRHGAFPRKGVAEDGWTTIGVFRDPATLGPPVWPYNLSTSPCSHGSDWYRGVRRWRGS